MAHTEVLNVKVRQQTGRREMRRLRSSGAVPAVIYGHGEPSVNLTLSADEVHTVLRHGGHMVKLRGEINEDALLREIQWDGLGSGLLHVDLTRVSATELVEVTLLVECRGEAMGTHHGGVIEQPLHELTIKCPAAEIPDKIHVNINGLDLGHAIRIHQLELPPKSTLTLDPETVVVQCVKRVEVDEEGVTTGPAEPEVIGRKPSEDDAED